MYLCIPQIRFLHLNLINYSQRCRGCNSELFPRFTIVVPVIVAVCRKYNNAEEGDLWEALTEEIRQKPRSSLPPNVTVKQLMDTWTLQEGYPVLTVTRNYSSGSAVLSQVRHTYQHWRAMTVIPVIKLSQCQFSRYSDGLQAGRPKNWGSIPTRGKRFISPEQHPDRLWSPTSLL
jgi:hypothetical protein